MLTGGAGQRQVLVPHRLSHRGGHMACLHKRGQRRAAVIDGPRGGDDMQLGQQCAQAAASDCIAVLIAALVCLLHPPNQLGNRSGRDVGRIVQGRVVDRLADRGQARQRLRAGPVSGKVGLPGQVDHGAPQRVGQGRQQPSPVEAPFTAATGTPH